MRLINATTFELKEFFDADLPPYAILSHRWGEHEVSYQDWLYVTKQFPPRWGGVYLEEEASKIKSSAGYKKIMDACMMARWDDLEWIWADTCCIDKTNLAELSEAINSMYRWYKGSELCYAYLQDVKIHADGSDGSHACRWIETTVRKSEWFLRGWTLQELLAPREVKFVSQEWDVIFHKSDGRRLLSEITGIPEIIFSNHHKPVVQKAHVSDIFSWAARRTTTRVEDRAYSLLGLIGINMPLLYGEGDGAFRRLQLEIARSLQDLSFLAWGLDEKLNGLNNTSRPPRETPIGIIGTVFLLTSDLNPFHNIGCFITAGALTHNLDLFLNSGREDFEDVNNFLTNSSIQVSNIGISFQSILIHTLNPKLCFAELPGTNFWIPMISSGEETYLRLCAPFRIVDAPRRGLGRDVFRRRKEKREQITLIFSDNDMSMAAFSKYSIPNGNCPYNVLLTFPHGLNQHSVRRAHPAQPANMLTDISILGLTVEEGLPEHAFGAVEFACKDSRTTLFFVLNMATDGKWPAPWRCKGELKVGPEDPHLDPDDLSTRARAYALEVSQEKELITERLFKDTMHSANIEPPSKDFSRGHVNVPYQLYLLDTPRPHLQSDELTQLTSTGEFNRFAIAQIRLPVLKT